MKHFLLTAGHNYYPKPATEDWIGCFSTRDEALSKVVVIEHKRVVTKGKNKVKKRSRDSHTGSEKVFLTGSRSSTSESGWRDDRDSR